MMNVLERYNKKGYIDIICYKTETRKIQKIQQSEEQGEAIMSNKKESLENQIKNIEEEYQTKEIKNFYKDIKDIRKEIHNGTSYIKDKEGNLIGNEKGKLNRWKEFVEIILNTETNKDDRLVETTDDRPCENEFVAYLQEKK